MSGFDINILKEKQKKLKRIKGRAGNSKSRTCQCSTGRQGDS
mgnify:CR=1 FL=1